MLVSKLKSIVSIRISSVHSDYTFSSSRCGQARRTIKGHLLRQVYDYMFGFRTPEALVKTAQRQVAAVSPVTVGTFRSTD